MTISTNIKVGEFEFVFTAGGMNIDGVTISPDTVISDLLAFATAVKNALTMYPAYYAICYINDGQIGEFRGYKIETLERFISMYDTAIKQDYFSIDKEKLIKDRSECIAEIEKQRIKAEKKTAKPARDGYVYLLKSSMGHYKIGRSRDVKKRLSTFGVQLPFKVELVCQIKTNNMYDLERDLHDLFSHKRVNGEWFTLDDNDAEYIKDLA